MDKNTIYGLLMMALVIFGFMWLNNKEQAQMQQQLQEQTEKQQAKEAEEAARALIVDSITTAESQNYGAILRLAGGQSAVDSVADAQTRRYTTSTVDLAYGPDGISGTVKANDTVLTYDAVINSRFGDDLTMDNRKAAIANLRTAIDQADRYRGFARYLSGEEKTVSLKNSKVSLELTNHGGYISRAVLADYYTYLPKGSNVKEIDTANVEINRPGMGAYSFILTSATQRFDTSSFYFTPEQPNDSTVVMKLDLGQGAMWALRYTLPKDSYIVRMELEQQNMDKIIPTSVATVELLWHQKMGRNELSRTFEQNNSGIYYKYSGDSPDNVSQQGDHSETLKQRLQWIAFKNQFFSWVMIPKGDFVAAEVNSVDLKDDPMLLKDLTAKAVMDYSSLSANPVSVDMFLGPNLYPLLSSLDKQVDPEGKESLDLTDMLPLGWPIFRWVNTLIIIPVFTFLSKFISNYGIIILILTVLIKLVLFPLTLKSLRSGAKMRALAPEIKEINEKYPGQENAMKRNQMTMSLYSKTGASPMAGCLPTLLQMPFLIAMFWFFPSCIELRGESFLWAKNLAAPDVIFTLPFSIPFYGSHVSLFCLLMTVTNIIYMHSTMQNQPANNSMPGMKVMMYIMPVMFLFIFNDYAAGLSYYYFVSLLITILLTYIVRLTTDEKKLHDQLMAQAAKPRKKSGWMARMEELNRKQQEMLREQQKKNNNSKGRR